jgi:hypothetical protein
VSAGFTPGPWDFARGVNEYGREGGPILGTVTVGGTWHIAVLPSDLGAESEANARLIAAAPKMYAALAEFEEQWNACGGNSHFGGLFQSVRDAAVDALAEADAKHWLNTSRDQLAKARGEQ